MPMAVRNPALRDALEPSRFTLPHAAQAYAEVITFPHAMLLSAPEDMEDVVIALKKIQRAAPELKARARELEIHEEV